MQEGVINRWIDFSPIDGPGNRTVIFFQGCNLNCNYCHNPETIEVYSDGRVIPDSIYLLTAAELIDRIKQNFSYISGITVSGGEPLLQAEFLKELFYKTKKLGLTNFIDTNGTIPLRNHKELLELTDGIMIDLKAFNNDDLIEITGFESFEIIKKNIVLLNGLGLLHEIRTVITEGSIDFQENVAEIAGLIAEINPAIKYKLIAYRDHGVENGGEIREPSIEEMNGLKNLALAKNCNNVQIIN
ncbi:MAG: radical SAM protein [Bacillota bacterium]